MSVSLSVSVSLQSLLSLSGAIPSQLLQFPSTPPIFIVSDTMSDTTFEIIPYGSSKRRRLATGECIISLQPAPSVAVLPDVPPEDALYDETVILPPQSGIESSLAFLDAETYQAHLERTARDKQSTATGRDYGRHFNRYKTWWVDRQAAMLKENPNWTPIPALPITAAKAASFIEHESTRQKVSDSVDVGSRIISLTRKKSP